MRSEVPGRSTSPVAFGAFFQEGPKLVPSNELNNGYAGGEFGGSVAVSADGNTALVGGTGDNAFAGAAWVYTRRNGVWTQGPKLRGSGEVGNAGFGASVALSADGQTALIGGSNDDNNCGVSPCGAVGAVWVFTRSGATWTQQGPKLTPSGSASRGGFGSAVSLSADGNTALISPESGDGALGWVFTRSGARWTQQAALGAGIGAGLTSAALSADGNTALVGVPVAGVSDAGAAWVYTRSGGSWTQQGHLTGAGESGGGDFGRSVSLSADGGTAVVGGNSDNQGAGAAWVFTRSGSPAAWSQQGPKLTGSGGWFGWSVSLSADGNSALVGAPEDNGGSAWSFARSGGTWSQQGSKLTPLDAVTASAFGNSVALAAGGGTALIGGPTDRATGGKSLGSAWVFVAPITPAETVGGGSPSELYHCPTCGAPVNTATGEFWHHFSDMTVPGRGAALSLSRTYSSALAGSSGPFGRGWSFSYGMSLSFSPGGTIIVHEEGGSQVTFSTTGSGYAGPSRVLARLVKNSDGSYTFTRRARTRFTFSAWAG